MAIEFKKLSEVEQIESASDNATVLIEEDGDIKRVAKGEVGVTSWNDLEDKPFGVKTEMVEILPEQSVTKETDAGGYWRAYITKANANSVIKDGEEYTVVFNGESESFVVDDGEMEKIDNFLIEIYDDRISVEWNKNFGETISLAIYEEQEVVEKLDPLFLPDSEGGASVIYADYYSDTLYIDAELQTEATVNDVKGKCPLYIATRESNSGSNFQYFSVLDLLVSGTAAVLMIARWNAGDEKMETKVYHIGGLS